VQPLLANSPSRSGLQPINRLGASSVPSRAHGSSGFRRLGGEFELSVSSSTATVTAVIPLCVTATLPLCVVSVAGAVDLSSADARADQETLDRSFARLSAFTLEPDQPTDKDLVGKPVYQFPHR
jgi:hypothetical protein